MGIIGTVGSLLFLAWLYLMYWLHDVLKEYEEDLQIEKRDRINKKKDLLKKLRSEKFEED